MIAGWDNRSLRVKKPCDECPFRKRSLPGYLGGHRLEPYRQPPSVGMPTSCHCSDYGASDERTSFCAGSLAVIANDPTVQPLLEYKEIVADVGQREDCFATVEAFAEHHSGADEFAARCEEVYHRSKGKLT
jgi:hypothetical protein